MGVLFILSIVTYKERVLFADAAYVVFNIINDQKFCIQESRYGSFITQMFPYFGQKFHLPLRSVLVLYGISFNLFFLAVNATLVLVLKQYRLAILMALYYFLFISESFIWISDVPQGVAFMFLLFGVMLYLQNKKANIFLFYIAFILLAILTLFTHFAMIIPLAFLWVYFIIEKKYLPFSGKETFILSGLIICIIVFKFLLSGGQHGREGSQLYWVRHLSIKDIINTFRTSVVKIFFRRCFTNYWLGILVFIVGMATLIKNKEKKLAVWTLVSVLGYIMIMGLTFTDNNYDTRLFHIESEWSGIGIIVATPFVFAFYPNSGYLLPPGY